jgi:hypothetical protein
MVFGMDDIRSKTVCLLGGLEGSRTRPRAVTSSATLREVLASRSRLRRWEGSR